ncbi:hypothetical protein [Neptunicella marina]|uniref:Uncharacterized protein n=1 Tax=Neptunicella marina TaxID=2125989 RepID=A0A8J6IX29_9ALTE|nr:hypothetical protein [Neptunicella marina]MBC3766953.1 hypothetical protein [Neptunicella marina]
MTTITHIYDKQRKLVSVTAVGEGTPETIVPMYQKARELAELHNANKVMVDLVGLSLDYDSEHIIDIIYRLIPVVKGLQVARIVDDTNFRQDLIEQLADSHQIHLKNFNNVEDALNWFSTEPQFSEAVD